MKENLGRDSSEQDSSDDDEDSEKNKKTTKIARRMTFGVKLDTEKNDTSVEKPRLTIGERLMQQMEAKAAKAKEAEKQASTTDTIEEKDSSEGNEGHATTDADETKKPDSTEAPGNGSEPLEARQTTEAHEPIPEDTLSATDWETEGEFKDSGEINLNDAPAHGSREAEPDITEDFVEVPVETAEPEVEEDPVDAELLETGLGDSEPPEPPEDITDRVEPADPGRFAGAGGTAERPWYDAAAADRLRREHEADINDAEYLGEKRGTRHGVTAGLFAGWLFGRRGKKKAEKEHVKELKTKNKEIKDLKTEQFAAKERISAIRRTQEQLRSNIQQESVKAAEQAGKLEKKPVESIVTATGETAKLPKRETVHSKPAHEVNVGQGEIAAAPLEIAAAAAMVAASEKKPAIKEQVKKAETAHEEQEITEETYQSAEGSRVETSAWHRIEIDEKTGKPVENPDVSYGEEFRRERRQEILPEDRTGGKSNGPASMLGGLATASMASGTAPSATEATATTEAAVLHVPRPGAVDPGRHLTSGNEVLRYASKPLIWAIAIIIVLVLFVVGILR